MSYVPPTASDFHGVIYQNYRKAITKRQWISKQLHASPSTLSSRKQDLAFAIAQQGCHAEHLGMCTASLLVLEAPSAQIGYAFAAASQDEATHSEALALYVISRGRTLEGPNAHHASMSHPLLDAELSYEERAALHTFLEGFALDQFKTFVTAFRGDPLSEIYAHIRLDEARHVALGMSAIKASFHLKDRNRVDLSKTEEIARKLGAIGPALFSWLGELEEVREETIRKRYAVNHNKRIREIRQLIEGARHD